MNKNYTIDTVFKEGLGAGSTGDAGAMWQRMQTVLQQEKHRKRRRQYYLLLLLLIPAAAWLLTGNKTGSTAAAPAFAHAVTHTQALAAAVAPGTGYPATQTAAHPTAGGTAYANTQASAYQTNSIIPPAPASGTIPALFQPAAVSRRIATPPFAAVTLQDGDAAAADDTPAENPLPPMQQTAGSRIAPEAPAIAGLQRSTAPAAKVTLPKTAPAEKNNRRPQLSLAAGTDLFAKLQTSGKYALVQLNMPLGRNNSLLLGAGISSHSTSQDYTVAEKQGTLNREIDAKLRGLTMVQLPILYQQQIPRTKLHAKAGLTPVYILNAAVTNIPNSFVGVVIPYRTFGLKDINRFNVLFTAGLQYNITPRLGAEVRGNYGLTELVKNSYLNQSNENNNFKAVQLGLQWNFGKKR